MQISSSSSSKMQHKKPCIHAYGFNCIILYLKIKFKEEKEERERENYTCRCHCCVCYCQLFDGTVLSSSLFYSHLLAIKRSVSKHLSDLLLSLLLVSRKFHLTTTGKPYTMHFNHLR